MAWWTELRSANGAVVSGPGSSPSHLIRIRQQTPQARGAASAPAGLALLAVGGYGRRQLFPYSDIDLLLLFDNDRAAQNSKALISPFLQKLWDSGLRVSHSVRTPVECTTLHDRNIEFNISLLDARFLAGDAVLSGKLSGQLARFVHAQRQSLVRNLAVLTRERHLKYHDTIYHLEPNIKETPGGLRDYQLLCWLGQIRNTTVERMGDGILVLAYMR